MKNLISVFRNNEEFKNINTTSNRSVYNKLHKIEVCNCTYCPYHIHENLDHKIYGTIINNIWRYPNWKLVSKK